MRKLPPFEDTAMHARMQGILLHMDAFDADSSLELINDALPHAADPEERYYLLGYRAEVLYYEGLFNEAMRDLDASGAIADALGDSTLIANTFNLKGLLHENIQDNRLALPYLRDALRWFPQRPAARYPVTELHHIHGNMGSYLTNLGELDSAVFHLRRSLLLAEQAGSARGVAVAWWGLGNAALMRQMPDSALQCYDRSFSTASAAKDHDIGVDALVGRARALAAAKRKGDALAALAEARAYLHADRSSIGLVTRRNFSRVASSTLRELGDLEGAMRDLAEWHRIDSTITANNIRSALATQAELLTSASDLEVARIERQRIEGDLEQADKERLLIAGLFAVALLAVTAIFLLNTSRGRARQHLAESELQRERQERTIAELRVREQVGRDLHDDLGVGLSGLKLRSEMALLRNNGGNEELLREQAQRADELMTSMRHIIWALQDDQSEVADLVAYTANYARNYLQEHGIDLTVRADGPWPALKLTTTERRNAFLFTKEALHNVVKHAGANQVELVIGWREGLIIDVIDDGAGLIGLDQGTRSSTGGNGLLNMRSRAAAIGGRLDLLPVPKGTHLRFTAPLGQPKLG
jgi:signal transduction histidine kinase